MDQTTKIGFPRTCAIDRQIDASLKALKVERSVVRTQIRAGASLYGVPTTYTC